MVRGGPGRRCVVLMNQSSWDDTLLGVRPSPGPGRGAVSPQSSQDKRRKRSLPGSTVRREGRAISADTGPLPEETYRGTLQGRTPGGEPSTVIVTRKGLGRSGRVWLTFLGALKTTVVMSDEQAGNLAELLHAARGSR